MRFLLDSSFFKKDERLIVLVRHRNIHTPQKNIIFPSSSLDDDDDDDAKPS